MSDVADSRSPTRPMAPLAHLPGADATLACLADLHVTVAGRPLLLHSQLLAASCGVLRSLFASCAREGWAAAVELALSGHAGDDVALFLRAACGPVDFSLAQTAAAVGLGLHPGRVEALLVLAAKLDAPGVTLVNNTAWATRAAACRGVQAGPGCKSPASAWKGALCCDCDPPTPQPASPHPTPELCEHHALQALDACASHDAAPADAAPLLRWLRVADGHALPALRGEAAARLLRALLAPAGPEQLLAALPAAGLAELGAGASPLLLLLLEGLLYARRCGPAAAAAAAGLTGCLCATVCT